jgi:hypothetical protein
MKITHLLLAEMDRETVGTRKALECVREGVLNHMAHHRGQLTVYLWLMRETVPAIYGPSANEGKS